MLNMRFTLLTQPNRQHRRVSAAQHLRSRHAARGFSLIEMMIVVAILGILSAVAWPSYTEHVRRGARAEARTGLMEAAAWLERAATSIGTYPLTAAFPAALKNVPSRKYLISIASTDGSTYALTATPQAGQATDKCLSFTLNEAGVRGVKDTSDVSGSADLIKECWSK